MQIPINVTARRVELPPALDALIRRRAGKLERRFDRIIRCDVVVEGPGQRHESGGPYDVRLDISVPGTEIVVNQRAAETLRRAVEAAFDAAERQVEEHSRKQRGEVKTAVRARFHEEPGHDGPQASTVEILGGPRQRPDEPEAAPAEERP